MAKIIKKIDIKSTLETMEVGERLSIPLGEACASSIRAAVWRKTTGTFTVSEDKKNLSTVITRVL